MPITWPSSTTWVARRLSPRWARSSSMRLGSRRRLIPDCPFTSVCGLHDVMLSVLLASCGEEVVGILNRHPDLARGHHARALTDHSTAEQASADFGQLMEAEAARLAEWNERCREKFGFPFIICMLQQGIYLCRIRAPARLHAGRRAPRGARRGFADYRAAPLLLLIVVSMRSTQPYLSYILIVELAKRCLQSPRCEWKTENRSPGPVAD
jgi:hypothetical protein